MSKGLDVTDALFSKVRQRLLGHLYGQPDKRFYTNEIIRLTKMGAGAGQRELGKLTSARLITVKKAGN